MEITSRQKAILDQIVEAYAETAAPVGSVMLAKLFGVSPATIRAEMARLEALGLILPPAEEEQPEAPEEVQAVAQERWQARLAKDWARADALRARLTELGWGMKDGRDSYQLIKL